MNSNIEIKAYARNVARLKEHACRLTDVPEELISQEDTFFHTPKGRLKLRTFSTDKGELIYYDRNDQAGPKQSNYSILRTDGPDALKAMLIAALGVAGYVRKKRLLYFVGPTRIHLDEVEGLSTFVELEVVMTPGQTIDGAHRLAHKVMQELEIRKEDLIDKAYVDLINECN